MLNEGVLRNMEGPQESKDTSDSNIEVHNKIITYTFRTHKNIKDKLKD